MSSPTTKGKKGLEALSDAASAVSRNGETKNEMKSSNKEAEAAVQANGAAVNRNNPSTKRPPPPSQGGVVPGTMMPMPPPVMMSVAPQRVGMMPGMAWPTAAPPAKGEAAGAAVSDGKKLSPPTAENGTSTGCKCRKSQCLKHYCECFHKGQSCGSHCKCVRKKCLNGNGREPKAAAAAAADKEKKRSSTRTAKKAKVEGSNTIGIGAPPAAAVPSAPHPPFVHQPGFFPYHPPMVYHPGNPPPGYFQPFPNGQPPWVFHQMPPPGPNQAMAGANSHTMVAHVGAPPNGLPTYLPQPPYVQFPLAAGAPVPPPPSASVAAPLRRPAAATPAAAAAAANATTTSASGKAATRSAQEDNVTNAAVAAAAANVAVPPVPVGTAVEQAETSQSALLLLRTNTQNPLLVAEKVLGPRPTSKEKAKLNAWNYKYKKLMNTGYEEVRKELQNNRRHHKRILEKKAKEEKRLREEGRSMDPEDEKKYEDTLNDLAAKKRDLEARRKEINKNEKIWQKERRDLAKLQLWNVPPPTVTGTLGARATSLGWPQQAPAAAAAAAIAVASGLRDSSPLAGPVGATGKDNASAAPVASSSSKPSPAMMNAKATARAASAASSSSEASPKEVQKRRREVEADKDEGTEKDIVVEV